MTMINAWWRASLRTAHGNGPVRSAGFSPITFLFASDGTELAVVEDRDVAFAAALQHEYLSVSVH